MTHCDQCGVELVKDANYCHNCGVSVAPKVQGTARPRGGSRWGELPGYSPSSARAAGWDADEDFAQESLSPVQTAPGTSREGTAPESVWAEVPPDADSGTEQDVWQGGYCVKAMAGPIVLSIAATLPLVLLVVLGALKSITWLWIVALAMVPALWITLLVRTMRRVWIARYRLTNQRLVRQLGLIRRHKDQLELKRVESVRIIQNVLHRICGVGSIEILSSDRRLRRVVMEGIENVDEVAETIRRLAGFRGSSQLSPNKIHE